METAMAKTNRTRLVGLGAALTGAGALAVSLVGNFEGLRLVAYQDVVGVWTACYGETKGIKPGMKFTREQCDVMFVERLQEFETGMRRCLTSPDALPDKTYVSFLSVTYNIGVGGWCGSSMVKRANAGNLTGACDALLMWNKAGGRVVKGLTNRRQAERKLCLQGLAEGKATPRVTAPETPAAPQPKPAQPTAPPIEVPGIAPVSASWPFLAAFGAAIVAVAGAILWRRRKR
jgi:lysozyme